MRFRRSLGIPVAAMGGTSAGDAVALYAAEVVVNGGTVSVDREALLRALVGASMDCGHWWNTDDIALLTAENAPQALITLKGRRLMTAVNGPTFTIDRGYAFDGATQYIDTNHNLATDSRAMAGPNVRIGAYETVNLQATTTTMGATVSGVATVSMRSRSASTTMLGSIASGSVTFTISADSRRLKVLSRADGGTTVKGWDAGAALTDQTAASAQNVLPSANLFLAARSNSGVADQFRAATLASAEWGAPLPDGTAAELAWYNALQAHMTAIGANV
jgi:hypothetical protein